MSKVMAFKSMSLDGFIAGPNDEIEPLHDWLFTTRPYQPGNWAKTEGKPEKFFGPEGANKDLLYSLMGDRRRDGRRPQSKGSYFVMTHNPPPAGEISDNFTFVTDGLESAVRQARAASKSGVVELMGGQIIQQGLSAGLLDEMVIVLIPVLLGKGIRLFDNLETGHITLNPTRVTAGPSGVTHLFYDIVH
jgi:dihydrofolate reductase